MDLSAHKECKQLSPMAGYRGTSTATANTIQLMTILDRNTTLNTLTQEKVAVVLMFAYYS